MSEGRIISYLTYKEFSKKYGIKLTTSKRKKTMQELATQIYNYEKKTQYKKWIIFLNKIINL